MTLFSAQIHQIFLVLCHIHGFHGEFHEFFLTALAKSVKLETLFYKIKAPLVKSVFFQRYLSHSVLTYLVTLLLIKACEEAKGCLKVPRSANILGAVSDPLFITPSTRFIDKIRFTSYELHLMGHGPLLLDRSVCLLLIAMWPSFGYFSMYCDISKFWLR